MLVHIRNRVFPLFSKSQAILPGTSLTQPALHLPYINTFNANQRYGFSTYFSELDKTDVNSYSEKKFQNPKYRGLIALWKKPLEQKRKRQ